MSAKYWIIVVILFVSNVTLIKPYNYTLLKMKEIF